LGKLGLNLDALTRGLIGERDTTLTTDVLKSMSQNIAAAAAGGITEAAAAAATIQSIRLEDIHELTVSPTGVSSIVYTSAPPVMTDARGRFSFDAVDPGTYRVTFSGTGYAKQDYGQRTLGGGGMPVTLVAGQPKADIVMRLVKVGAVSGRIRDNAGQPVVGVPVELSRLTYDATGQQKLQRVAVAPTDDLGEYRVYAIIPGRYYVSSGGQAGRGGYSTPNRIPQNYTQVYYPAAGNQSSATTIDVGSGADVRGVDLVVSLLPPYRVRGRVSDPRTGRPPQRVNLVLNFQDSGANGAANLLTGVNPGYNPADGSFDLQNIPAGTYFLGARLPGGPGGPGALPIAWVPLNVNADVSGIALTLEPGGSLNGRLRAEGNTALNSVRVQLTNEPRIPIPQGFESQPAAVAVDGNFRIDNLQTGTYRVSVTGLPEGFYVKEARLGETDVLNAPLRYSLLDTAVLDLLISPNVGAIDGTAVPGAQVVLIPNSNRERTELFRQVTADGAGRFAIPSVAPGEYTLAAWETLEPYAFFDPSLIRQAEDQGKAVRVVESSRQTVNITGIR
jgi:hypothetical protein